MNRTQQENITRLLSYVAQMTRASCGLNGISGGFAVTELQQETRDKVGVRIRFGVQSDCQDSVTESFFHILKNPLKKRRISPKDLYFQAVIP